MDDAGRSEQLGNASLLDEATELMVKRYSQPILDYLQLHTHSKIHKDDITSNGAT